MVVCGLAAGTAGADLLSSLPGTPTVPTVSVPTLPSDPTGVTGTVGGVVGGVVDGAGGTVGGAIDTVLGSAPGSSGGTLPTDTVTDLVDQLLGGGSGSTGGTGTTTGGGTSGTSGTSGGTSGGGSPTSTHTGAGGVVSGPVYGANSGSDTKAPSLRFTVLSKLRQAARTGRLRMRVHASEPAVVAFTTLIRPGKAVKVHGRTPRVSRKLIRIKSIVLAFHRAGNVTFAVKLPKAARRNLARTRNARVAIQAWTSDVAHNQARRNIKRTVKR